MLCRPSRSIAGVRVGAASLKYKPTDGCTDSGLPLGCMCISTTRSVSTLERQARSFGSSGATCPGVHPRKCPSGYCAECGIRPRRSQARGSCLVETRAPRVSCRCGCSRGARPSGCPGGTRAPRTKRVADDRQRDHEDAKHIGAVRLQRVRLGERNDRGPAGRAASLRSHAPAAWLPATGRRIRGSPSTAPPATHAADQSRSRRRSADAVRRTDRSTDRPSRAACSVVLVTAAISAARRFTSA